MPLNPAQHQQVLDALRPRGALATPCSGCARSGTFILNKFVATLPNIEDVLENGVAAITLICSNCGYIRAHSMQILGLDSTLAELGEARKKQ